MCLSGVSHLWSRAGKGPFLLWAGERRRLLVSVGEVGSAGMLVRGVGRKVRRGGNGGVVVTSLAGVRSAVYGCFIVYRKGSPDRINTVMSSVGRFAHGNTSDGPFTISKLQGTR